jgi:hypothetical protein
MERLILLPGSPRPADVPEMIRCTLNPSEVVIARSAGLAERPEALALAAPPASTAAGELAAAPSLAALGYGGPGRTVLTLWLLFEAPTEPETGAVTEDVRRLTRPLYSLAGRPGPGIDLPCPVDLIWGKHWAFRGTIARLSETLDDFTPAGLATRAWVQIEFWALPQAAPPQTPPVAPLSARPRVGVPA